MRRIWSKITLGKSGLLKRWTFSNQIHTKNTHTNTNKMFSSFLFAVSLNADCNHWQHTFINHVSFYLDTSVPVSFRLVQMSEADAANANANANATTYTWNSWATSFGDIFEQNSIISKNSSLFFSIEFCFLFFCKYQWK